MRILRGLAGLLLACALLPLPARGAHAQQTPHVYLCDNFESIYLGREPSYGADGYWTAGKSGAQYASDIAASYDAQRGSKVMTLSAAGIAASGAAGCTLSQVGASFADSRVWLSFAFMSPDTGGEKGLLLRGDTASDVARLVTLRDGRLYAGGQDAGAVSPGQWGTVQLSLDVARDAWTLWDGDTPRYTFSGGGKIDYTRHFEIRFYANGTSGSDAYSSWYLDDVAVYGGTEGFVPAEALDAYQPQGDDSPYQTQPGWFPSPEDIAADFARTSGGTHPRLMLTPDKVTRLRAAAAAPGYVQDCVRALAVKAENILSQPLPAYTKNDGYRLDAANPVLDDIETLALLYLLTDDTRYAQRAWEELEAVAAFPDWNPDVYIITGTLSLATAIGYDWLYGYLTDSQRQTLLGALQRHSFGVAQAVFAGQPVPDGASWTWDRALNNWAAVCNGGIAAAALAVFDAQPEASAELLANTLRSVDNYLSLFAPDGGYKEGMLYWGYSTYYFFRMLACMQTALGTDYGRFDVPGVSHTAYFPLYMQSAVYSFNFGDSNTNLVYPADFLYIAGRTGDGGLAQQRLDAVRADTVAPTAYDVLWYGGEAQQAQLAPDRYFRGVESGSLRSGFADEMGLYLGFHGGKNGVSHSHTDSGTFVLDAQGERWFLDIGKEPYSYDLSTAGTTGYYRHRTEGHNCLVIDPAAQDGQNGTSFSPVTDFVSTADAAHATMDLSAAYSDAGCSVTRTYALTQGRTQAVVRDQIAGSSPHEVWWFAHTQAAVTLSPDGRSARLEQNGKVLMAYLDEAPAGARLGVMDAVALPQSSVPAKQTHNTGIRKLYIKLEAVTDAQIAMRFVPQTRSYIHEMGADGWREDFDDPHAFVPGQPPPADYDGDGTAELMVSQTGTATVTSARAPGGAARGNCLKFTAGEGGAAQIRNTPAAAFVNNRGYVVTEMDWYFPVAVGYGERAGMQQRLYVSDKPDAEVYIPITYNQEGIGLLGYQFPVSAGRWTTFRLELHHDKQADKVLADIYLDGVLKLAARDVARYVAGAQAWPQEYTGVCGLSTEIAAQTGAGDLDYRAYLDNVRCYAPDGVVAAQPRITMNGTLTAFPGDGANVWVRLGNGADVPQRAVMAVAAYDGDALVRVQLVEHTVPADAVSDFRVDVDWKGAAADAVRIYLLDGLDTLRPLAHYFERFKGG